MKRIVVIVAILIIGVYYVSAQTPAPPWQVGVPNASAHTICTVTAGVTQMCLASDGLWLSINGAAYVQVQTGVAAVGVTSVTANGVKMTGDVVLPTIPSKVAITVTTPVATGALQ